MHQRDAFSHHYGYCDCFINVIMSVLPSSAVDSSDRYRLNLLLDNIKCIHDVLPFVQLCVFSGLYVLYNFFSLNCDCQKWCPVYTVLWRTLCILCASV